MPVYSMTGYASAQRSASPESADNETKTSSTVDGAQLGMEIRTVNSRYLDLTFRLPEDLRQFEPTLRELLNGKLKRGKVELRASVEAGGSGAVADASPRLLQKLNSAQDNIRAWLPGVNPLSVADILRIAASEQTHSQDWNAVVMPLAEAIVQDLMQARLREGERLALTLLERIDLLRELAAKAVPLVPQLVAQQRQRFLDRWKEAMALAEGAPTPESVMDRALSEATAFAIRIDVAEEITRLNSHLDEIQRLIKKGGEIGKRLDFLIQELHREANTLGSKSAALELTHISVDMKVLIEQMREQVQNIE